MLYRTATLLSQNRTRGTGFLASRPQPSISVSPLPLPDVPVSASRLQKPYFFAGFPTISLSSESAALKGGEAMPKLAQFVVSEMMVLAGRIAADYGSKHKLALAYRYQHRPENTREAEEILGLRTNLPSPLGAEAVSPLSETGQIGHGLINFDEMLTKGLTINAGGYSSRPLEHFSLGIADDAPRNSPFSPKSGERDALTASGYARATSPLRRYPDMLAHWQIKHHLIHSTPLFPHHHIERILPQLERQEVSAKQLMRSAERYWLYALLQRRLLEGKGEAQKEYTAKVVLPDVRVNSSTLCGRVRVNLDELGIPADMEWDAAAKGPEPGDVFKVVPVAVILAGIRGGLVVRRV